MTIRTNTTSTDINRDGIVDQTDTTVTETIDGRVVSETMYDVGTLYPHQVTHQKLFGYNESGLVDLETMKYDWDGNGTWDETSTLSRLRDGEGHIIQELVESGDFNGDGVPGDYSNLTTFTENFAGSVTEKLTTYSAWGVTTPGDYIRETWTYAADGQRVTSHKIDDPFKYDCEITDFYNYNSKGQITTIKQQNEIRFGDERARTIESNTYNSDGTLKTHTDWAGYTDEGYFQRKDIAYTWKTGYDSQKITYDLQGDFKPEIIKLVEHWFNSDGHLTHTLVSRDMDGKGGPLAGGFDSRDLTVATWVGDHKVAETTDYGNDGIIDISFTSVDAVLLVA